MSFKIVLSGVQKEMKFGPVFQEELSFKDISYLLLWRPFVQRNGTICAILLEVTRGTIL